MCNPIDNTNKRLFIQTKLTIRAFTKVILGQNQKNEIFRTPIFTSIDVDIYIYIYMCLLCLFCQSVVQFPYYFQFHKHIITQMDNTFFVDICNTVCIL